MFISNTVLVLVFPVLAFRVLVSVNIADYNIYAFYAYTKIFASDGVNLLFLTVISVGISALSAAGVLLGAEKENVAEGGLYENIKIHNENFCAKNI